MRHTRNIKDKLLLELSSKENSRGDLRDYQTNFLRNFSRSYTLFISVKDTSEDEEIKNTALEQHIISLISIFETFLRDIFSFIVKSDSNFKEEIITSYNLKINIADTNIPIEIVDILSEFFNFQDIRDIEYAFKPIIAQGNFFEDIGNFVLPFYNHKNEEIRKFCLNVSISNWKELLNEIISERHKLTHDANYVTVFQYGFFDRYQKTILYFPQVFSLLICAKYNLPYIALHIKDKKIIPYICELEDILSKWELVDE